MTSAKGAEMKKSSTYPALCLRRNKHHGNISLYVLLFQDFKLKYISNEDIKNIEFLTILVFMQGTLKKNYFSDS